MNADDLRVRALTLAERCFEDSPKVIEHFKGYVQAYQDSPRDVGLRAWLSLVTWGDPDEDPDPERVLSALIREWFESSYPNQPVSAKLKQATPRERKTENDEHKEDFQSLCVAKWRESPEMTITGPHGVVCAVGGPYLHHVKQGTLEKWAREVAPDGVRNRRGRPRKSDEPGK